ncbi:hypothetical protein HD554DRAFT_2089381 [Boletus coccyginus]|nr:hypothetical protein HD554DRAFT_2089381 [Boletus coccyginus]
MSVPLSVDPKRATTDVVVVSPNTWEIRVSTLARLASKYRRPTFERAYLIVIMALTFLVPITTYYVTLQSLESTTTDDAIDSQVWFARFSCFAVAVVTWVVLSAPMVVWKYLGKIRVMRLADQWTRADALSAASYGAAPVWKATAPGLFRDAVVRTIVPSTVDQPTFFFPTGVNGHRPLDQEEPFRSR